MLLPLSPFLTKADFWFQVFMLPRAEIFCRLLRFTPRSRIDLRNAFQYFTRRKSLQTFAKRFLMHAPAKNLKPYMISAQTSIPAYRQVDARNPPLAFFRRTGRPTRNKT